MDDKKHQDVFSRFKKLSDIPKTSLKNNSKVKKSVKTLESHVMDGNCLFGVIGLFFKREEEDACQIACDLRECIYDHIKEMWFEECIFTNQAWHEMIYLTHNVAVTALEREEYTDWGENPTEQLHRFVMEKDSFYGSVPELLAFCEIMLLYFDTRVCFRIFKHVQKDTFLRCDAVVPQIADTEDTILVDLKSIGKMDTQMSHYKLCKSGSF